MTFGSYSITSTQSVLPSNQFPVSSVAVPGTANGDLTALEGGPISTDSNSNKTAPASMYIKDGSDIAQGTTTDVAVVGDNAGSISAKLRGLTKIFNDVWDSVNHRLATRDIAQSGYVALSSPPTATNVGTDTTFTFSSQVNQVCIQNNTGVNANIAFDTAATLGSLLLVPGQTFVYPKKVTTLHILTAAAQNVNGSTTGNIVLLGEL